MIVDAGLNLVKTWIELGTGSSPSHIGVGLGTTAPRTNDAALLNEVYATTTRTPSLISRSNDSVHFVMTMGVNDGSTATYAEHGLFSANTGGSMFDRVSFPDTSKDVNVVMESIISVEVGSYLP